jgi:hypothetical protein
VNIQTLDQPPTTPRCSWWLIWARTRLRTWTSRWNTFKVSIRQGQAGKPSMYNLAGREKLLTVLNDVCVFPIICFCLQHFASFNENLSNVFVVPSHLCMVTTCYKGWGSRILCVTESQALSCRTPWRIWSCRRSKATNMPKAAFSDSTFSQSPIGFVWKLVIKRSKSIYIYTYIICR